MTDEQHSEWQRDLEEMETLLVTLGFASWITFWSLVHYKIVTLV